MALIRPLTTTVGVLCAASLLIAQEPRALAPEEYGRWEQLAAQRKPLSPDGNWMVYGITRASRENELRIARSSGGDAVTIAFGEQPAFSDNSRWLAALVGMSEDAEAKLRKDKKPVRKKLSIVELASGAVTTVDGIESFAFSASGTHFAMRHYAPEPATPASPAPGEEPAPKGVTLVVRELVTGADTTFGEVSEIAWQTPGPLLAFAVTVDGGGQQHSAIRHLQPQSTHARLLGIVLRGPGLA